MTAETPKRPVVTICAWCPDADLSAGENHTICAECFERMTGRKPSES